MGYIYYNYLLLQLVIDSSCCACVYLYIYLYVFLSLKGLRKMFDLIENNERGGSGNVGLTINGDSLEQGPVS